MEMLFCFAVPQKALSAKRQLKNLTETENDNSELSHGLLEPTVLCQILLERFTAQLVGLSAQRPNKPSFVRPNIDLIQLLKAYQDVHATIRIDW